MFCIEVKIIMKTEQYANSSSVLYFGRNNNKNKPNKNNLKY